MIVDAFVWLVCLTETAMHPFTASYCPLYCSVLLLVVCVLANLVSSNNTTSLPGEAMSKLFASITNEMVYNKNIRPYYGEKPVELDIVLFVADIYSVSEINMDFTIDIVILQYWNDPRLAFTPPNNLTDELVLTSDFEKLVWLPNTYFFNFKSLSPHLSFSNQRISEILVHSSGNITYRSMFTTTINCPMDLKYFPVDKQECGLILSNSHFTKDLVLNWAPREKFPELPSSFYVNPAVNLPTFILKSFNKSTHEYNSSRGKGKLLTCSMHFERSLGYYINQIYVPSFLIVVISWIPFWLDRDHHARVGLGVTTVLTITTLISNTNESFPKVSYIKSIDIYLFVCFLMVFMALIEFAAIGWFESVEQACQLKQTNEHDLTVKLDGEQDESKPNSSKTNSHNNKEKNNKRDPAWIDKLSRILFPTGFITFNFVYVGTLIYIKYSE